MTDPTNPTPNTGTCAETMRVPDMRGVCTGCGNWNLTPEGHDHAEADPRSADW